MPNLIKCVPNSQEWHDIRRQGLGGSDAAAALGLSQWKTPYEVYQEKRGELEPEDQSHRNDFYWGHKLEPLLREEYAKLTGETLRSDLQGIYQSQNHSFLLATPDDITESERIVDYKSATSSRNWGAIGTDDIPRQYLIQMQHYMLVTGFKVADLAVWFLMSREYRIYEIERDDRVQELLLNGEIEFWRRVEDGEPPDPITVAEARQRYRMSENKEVIADETVEKAYRVMTIGLKRINDLQAAVDNCKVVLMDYMKDADALLDDQGNYLATWRLSKETEQFDRKAFAQDHPELYKKYLKPARRRRPFLPKFQP